MCAESPAHYTTALQVLSCVDPREQGRNRTLQGVCCNILLSGAIEDRREGRVGEWRQSCTVAETRMHPHASDSTELPVL